MAKSVKTQPPEWIQRAPVRVSAAREMLATPTEVFDALCDHESWPEWFSAIHKVERLGEQRDGMGSRRRVHVNRRISLDEEFNVWEPGKAWGFTVYEASIGAFRSLNELVEIQAISDERTRVTYTMGFDPSPVFDALLKAGGKRFLKKNLEQALVALSQLPAVNFK